MEKVKGLIFCLFFALICNYLGKIFPIIGGAVFAILIGMLLNIFIKEKESYEAGVKFCSKKLLQYAVILLGFGLNLNIVLETGRQSLPIIISTIFVSLLFSYVIYKITKMDGNISILIGVGSSICGGSAIAATAPVINAKDDEVAQAISVIFLYNVLAALIFPFLGNLLNFDTSTGQIFGIFAGTAINDTSSVTAAASTWDNLYNLGTQTLDKAVIVKLTRTLAIIPITLFLSVFSNKDKNRSITKSFPSFIIFFLLASLITTLAVNMGVDIKVFKIFKHLSKFFIIIAMFAIGFNSSIIKLIKSGFKPIIMGLVCWISIIITTVILINLYLI